MRNIIIMCCVAFFSNKALSYETHEVRVAVLNFGTVNWEIDVIRHHQLDLKYDFSLKVMPVAGKNAAAVALQGNAVDVIYSDWVWVNRQRHQGRRYAFSPVSAATGGIFVQSDSPVRRLFDFNGERFGIAGGPVDKSWLILQAYYKREHGVDFRTRVKPVFAAPPLLNKLMYDGKLPAVSNFWHYSARLRAKGFRPIIQVSEILDNLGIDSSLPVVGWVFDEAWADGHAAALSGFLQASKEARRILQDSDAEWQRIRPLLRAENDRIFTELKNRYRKGVAGEVGHRQRASYARLYEILADEGGVELTGGASKLDASIFWQQQAGDVASVRLDNSQHGVRR